MRSTANQLNTIVIIESDEEHKVHIDVYQQNQAGISLISKDSIALALSYLETIQRTPSSLPTLLLVDHNELSKADYALFDELQKRALRSSIPVIVLSDTDDRSTIEEAYDRGVASFFMKPRAYSEWHSFLNLLIQYWFKEVTLPGYSIARQGA